MEPVAPERAHGVLGEARAQAARRLAAGDRANPALNRLAELAARLLGTPSAQVSVISDVQYVAGGAGLAPGAIGSEGPLEDSLCTVTLRSGGPLLVQQASLDERVAHLPPVTTGAVVSYLGVPLVTEGGHLIGALCVFGPEPRSWSDADVALLEQLAAPVVAELELAALSADYETERIVWELAIDAAEIGVFDWDLRSGELRWDDRLLDLFGLDRETFGGTIESFNAVVHPDDLPRVSHALQDAIQGCTDYAAEYRIVLPDGGLRWIAARGRALCDDAGTAVRLIGAAFDTTAVQEGEARVARVLETMPTAFFHLDTGWRFSYVNSEAERVLGHSRQELLGGVVWDLFPAAVGSDFEANYRRAVELAEPVAFDAHYPEPLNAWYEVRAWPVPDGLSVYFTDVTARVRDREKLEEAARRSALLAEVTVDLTGTLDVQDAVTRLAASVVPALADWCLVTVVDDVQHSDWRRRLRDVGGWHVDPAMRPVLDRYAELRVEALTDESYVAQALQQGAPVVVEADVARAIENVLLPGEARQTVRRLDPWSGAIVPLHGRGAVVGLLSVFRSRGRPAFSEVELETLLEVAGRAGLALDNARLFAQQRDLAEGLQRSMLTPPPTVPGLDLAVLYAPAAQVAQVGGDWYDAFRQPDGSTTVVIGDVVGHDTAAAAAMGQIRSLLRAVAVHGDDGPAQVLHGLDRVMQALSVESTATVLVARVDPATPGQPVRLRWANGGHPPPYLLTEAGGVETLTAGSSDLLLGLDPNAERVECTTTLAPGATLFLYTDGLVERRGRSIDDGLAELGRVLRRLGGHRLPVEVLCEEVLQAMLPEQREDDVALVAVRVQP